MQFSAAKADEIRRVHHGSFSIVFGFIMVPHPISLMFYGFISRGSFLGSFFSLFFFSSTSIWTRAPEVVPTHSAPPARHGKQRFFMFYDHRSCDVEGASLCAWRLCVRDVRSLRIFNMSYDSGMITSHHQRVRSFACTGPTIFFLRHLTSQRISIDFFHKMLTARTCVQEKNDINC